MENANFILKVYLCFFNVIYTYINNISFEMWLKTIAVNSDIDFIRRSRQEKLNDSVDDETCLYEFVDTMFSNPEDNFIFKQEKSLNPYCYGISSLTSAKMREDDSIEGLNPYCYGISSLTSDALLLCILGFCLNPYCYGISSLTLC